MTLIAEIIVDVPTMQTNTPYSYQIPESLIGILRPGMRVVVPFGNGSRKVQGFVWCLREQTDTEFELKMIETVMDLKPVLNDELLALAGWLSDQTYAFTITCLLTMLPNALKASYEKWVMPTDKLPETDRQVLFGDADRLLLDETKIATDKLSQLLKLASIGQVTVTTAVKDRGKVKRVHRISRAQPVDKLREIRQSLRKTAVKQGVLLDYLISHDGAVFQPELEKRLKVTATTIKNAADKGWLTRRTEEVYRDPLASAVTATQPLKLNAAQQKAVLTICQATNAKQATTFLLEGVTGSGKTEVYLQSIQNAVDQQQSALMLVPEIALTPQIVGRVRGRFGARVAVLHSGLSAGERYDEWRRIERGEATVVVGARSAIFAPLKNLGVIIVDEEHETSYKQDDNPRYHARDVALWRGDYHGCPVVLGSATPSLESRARAQKNVYVKLSLPDRINQQTMPEVTVIDMTQEMQHHAESNFSTALLAALERRLEKGEQSILMLNRRGFSSFIMCRDCGFVLKCPNCDISLTLHMDSKTMKCHYCGHQEAIPRTCPACHSTRIRYYGTGTQKVEAELSRVLPNARVLRMDVDTTRRKGAHERLLKRFGDHQADILLGTQMIAKGLDYPDVTLVGVLNADTGLGMPDFRASERTFDLLTQVSGRAGRADKPGQVYIQTYNPKHYAIQLAQAQDYERFFVNEMKVRHLGNYPPYFFAVKVTASSEDEREAAQAMIKIVRKLKQVLSTDAIILGPTPGAVARVNNRYYYQLIIKYKREPALKETLFELLNNTQSAGRRGLLIAIDNNPMTFM